MSRTGKPTYVLGTGLSHDGSACLLRDGRIAVAIEKERISRRKHDGGNDDEAILYCLDAEGITLDDVELVVQNANFSMFERGNSWFQGPRIVARHCRIVTVSHHLAHAYSAIGAAPFDEAGILVIDGCGNAYDECLDRSAPTGLTPLPSADTQHLYFEKDSYYFLGEGKLTPVFKDYSTWGYRIRGYPMCPPTTKHSIGGLYQAASVYCLGGIDDSGKLMGLAPYGRPGIYKDDIFALLDGRVHLNYDWMAGFDRPRRTTDDFKTNFQYYADIAYWVQQEVERALLYVVDHRYELCKSKNLAYAGGVALNAVANRRILQESKFRNLFIQPAAGDNGLAIGCAYYGWMCVLQRERRKHDGASCFGRIYHEAAIAEALAQRTDRLEFTRTADMIEQTSSLLAEGNIVGWFQGGSEFGPRALGHRSILADPRRSSTRDFINSRIKFREDFRPFAPAVLNEDAPAYFSCNYSSPYMILVAPVRPERRVEIQAVVHVDGSCRIQTVTAESDVIFYSLLRSFKKRTAVPILLNTSLNRKRMPIVETPEQAIAFFLECELDALVIGNFVVRKKTLPQEKLKDLDQSFRHLKGVLRRRLAEIGPPGGICELQVLGTRTWTIDLSPEESRVYEGKASRPDVTMRMAEADFWDLIDSPAETSRLLVSRLLQEERLQISGSMTHAEILIWLLQQR